MPRSRTASTFFRTVALACLPACLLAGATIAQPTTNPTGTPSSLAVYTALQDYYGELERLATQQNAASLSVVVVRRGEPVFMAVFGSQDRTTGVPAGPNTLYHQASVSKPFVSMAVMQLVDRGLLQLDQPVSSVLPELAATGPGASSMTVRHLLQHTAGLPDVEDYRWGAGPDDDGAGEQYLAELAGIDLAFPPGEGAAYSNIGYDLLGIMISRVSGQTFEAYMAENVLAPAGMVTASFLRADAESRLEARGHVYEDGRPAPIHPYNRRHAPSSTLQASPRDMASILAQMTRPGGPSGRLVSASGLAAMWRDGSVQLDGQRVALGWFDSPFRGHRRYSHTGGDIGFASYMAVFPDDALGIALMTNSPMAMDTQQILFTAVSGAFDLFAEQ